MFTESAELYDAIYFTFKDYPAESEEIARVIRNENALARTVLDVACGTAEHARILTAAYGFQVDGVDLDASFVGLAQKKNPGGTFTKADMTAFNLGQTYDAVICMFSSIGYVQTLPRLEQALRCFRGHLAAGGVVLVEPWFPPGKLEDGYRSTLRAQAGGATITRNSSTTLTDRMSRLRFDYAIEEHGRTRTVTEEHVMGLFTREEMLLAFSAAGLDATYLEKTVGGRGLYVARAA